MPETVESPDLIGTAEAADITGLDRRTLHRKVERGELKVVQKLPGLRGSYIFNRRDIIALKALAEGGDAA
jgi:predicted DNA-binding protein (UPF0251 family)